MSGGKRGGPSQPGYYFTAPHLNARQPGAAARRVCPYPKVGYELICFLAYRVIRAAYGADRHGPSQLRDPAN
jgi:hypothetical protein